MIRKATILAAATLMSGTLAAPAGDQVHALPDAGPLPTPWYSGYLQTTAPSK
jgi:hypothetical protein